MFNIIITADFTISFNTDPNIKIISDPLHPLYISLYLSVTLKQKKKQKCLQSRDEDNHDETCRLSCDSCYLGKTPALACGLYCCGCLWKADQ